MILTYPTWAIIWLPLHQSIATNHLPFKSIPNTYLPHQNLLHPITPSSMLIIYSTLGTLLQCLGADIGLGGGECYNASLHRYKFCKSQRCSTLVKAGQSNQSDGQVIGKWKKQPQMIKKSHEVSKCNYKGKLSSSKSKWQQKEKKRSKKA